MWAVTEPPKPANVLHADPTATVAAVVEGGPVAGRRGAARHPAPHGSETQQFGGLSQLECWQGGALPHVTQADLDDGLLKVIV